METDGKGYKVLVVDDEEILCELIVQLMAMEGHQCQAVANGREALECMEVHSFDAVITDINMPEIDGITLTREVLSRYGDLPIMIITGFPDRYSSESALKAGAREFICKPFTSPELIVRFNKMMADFAALSEIKRKRSEIAQKSSQILDEVKHEAKLEIKQLQDEIEALRHRPPD